MLRVYKALILWHPSKFLLSIKSFKRLCLTVLDTIRPPFNALKNLLLTNQMYANVFILFGEGIKLPMLCPLQGAWYRCDAKFDVFCKLKLDHVINNQPNNAQFSRVTWYIYHWISALHNHQKQELVVS